MESRRGLEDDTGKTVHIFTGSSTRSHFLIKLKHVTNQHLFITIFIGKLEYGDFFFPDATVNGAYHSCSSP